MALFPQLSKYGMNFNKGVRWIKSLRLKMALIKTDWCYLDIVAAGAAIII